jgi:hypothetical protein
MCPRILSTFKLPNSAEDDDQNCDTFLNLHVSPYWFTAILILEPIAGLARLSGAASPQSVAMQARCKLTCMATDLN